jgi:aspartate/methionine/tyrosine aminotransferase
MKLSDRVLGTEKLSYLEVAKMARAVPDAIYLNIGEPDFPTPSHIVEAAKEAMDRGDTHYTPDEGLLELRQAIAERESRKLGLKLDEENIVVTAGGTGGTYAALMASVDPGDQVIVPSPYYSGYYYAVRMTGGTLVGVKQKEEKAFQLDADELERKVSPRTKAMIVVSPNNPTGVVLTEDTLKVMAEVACEKDLLVISDEVYDQFVFDGTFRSIASLPGMSERTIVVNSFSKTYAMTGWRIGYAVGPKEVMNQVAKASHSTTVCVNSIAQYAALAALRGTQEPTRNMLETYRVRRRILVDALTSIPQFSLVEPQGAFFAFPNISATEMTSMDLFKYLLKEARVVVLPGYPFFGEDGENHIRLSYSTSTDKLKEAMDRLKEAMRRLESQSQRRMTA